MKLTPVPKGRVTGQVVLDQSTVMPKNDWGIPHSGGAETARLLWNGMVALRQSKESNAIMISLDLGITLGLHPSLSHQCSTCDHENTHNEHGSA